MSSIRAINWRFITGLLLTGVLSGIGGILLTLLLHAVQHLAYGYSPDHLLNQQSFLSGISAASPARRFLALTLCGLVAGIGWMLLYRHGRRLVGISGALQAKPPFMPEKETLIHILLQIVTVALGSPLGRETAPRELGALCAARLSRTLALTPEQTRLLIACGAGGGLAAVYNVPLGGALFVLEVLLSREQLKFALHALVASVLAALVARGVLGNEYQYHIDIPFKFSDGLLIWAAITGPIFGVSAWLFARLCACARQAAPQDRRLVMYSLANFTLLGVLVIWLPQLAGNGKGAAELSFTSQLSLPFALLLLVGKVLVVWGSLRAGARGGLLTPSLACGALLGAGLGAIWSLPFPGVSPGAFAIVGATAFLGTSMNMPLTSIVLVMEFTHIESGFVLPLAVGTAIAACVSHYLRKREYALGH